MVKQARKRGPKPLPKDEVKRVPLNMRTTPALRKKLEDERERSGRSLVQEVEYRMERSFLLDDFLSFLADDPATKSFIRDVLTAIKVTEGEYEKSVWSDLEAHSTASTSIASLLKSRAPEMSDRLRKRIDAQTSKAKKEREAWSAHAQKVSAFKAGPQPIPAPSPLDEAELLGEAVASVLLEESRKTKALAGALANAKKLRDEAIAAAQAIENSKD